MVKKTYSEKLLDPRWQKKRLEILQRDEFTCQICNSFDKTLHVHHKAYLTNTDPWDYDEYFLITLCYQCHKKESDLFSKDGVAHLIHLLKVSPFFFRQIQEICEGVCNCESINPEKDAEMISWALQDKLLLQYLRDRHSEYLAISSII